MKRQSPDLTVIIPCYNEAGRLKGFFDLIRSNIVLNWEWIFVNDGSTDETAQLIQSFGAIAPEKIRIVSLPVNSGKGRAVREGILHAGAPLLGYIDADLAASPLLFLRFLDEPELIAGREVIIGIRKNTADCHVRRYLYRHLLGRIFQAYTSSLTGLRLYDSQCGFKLMAFEPARQIASLMKIDGFAFDVELLILAHRLGLNLRQVQIPWEEKGHNKIRPHHLLEMARDVHKIWWRFNVGKRQS